MYTGAVERLIQIKYNRALDRLLVQFISDVVVLHSNHGLSTPYNPRQLPVPLHYAQVARFRLAGLNQYFDHTWHERMERIITDEEGDVEMMQYYRDMHAGAIDEQKDTPYHVPKWKGWAYILLTYSSILFVLYIVWSHAIR